MSVQPIAIAIFSGIMMLAGAQAMAQTGPKSLIPGGFSSTPQPVPGSASTTQGAETGASPSISGIAIEALDKVDPDSIGVLDLKTGGFAADIWAGSDRRVLEALLQKLSHKASSVAQSAITRRLILTRAAFPPSSAGPDASDNSTQAVAAVTSEQAGDEVIALPAVGAVPASNPPQNVSPVTELTSLLEIRLKNLFNMGLLSDVLALRAEAPARGDNPVIEEIIVETLMVMGRDEEACGLADETGFTTRFWLRLEIFCQALRGNLTAAQFNATLLRDEGDPDDAVFLNLIEPLLGGRARQIESVADLDGLEAGLLAQMVEAGRAGTAWPADALEAENPAIRLLALAAREVSDEDQIDGLEQLVDIGAASRSFLIDAYRGVSFPETVFEQVITTSEELSAPLARALLFQAIEREQNPAARAELIASTLAVAALSDRRRGVRRILRDAVMSLVPDRTLWWFARDAIEVMATPVLLTQPAEVAIQDRVETDRLINGWARILRDEAARNPKAAAEALEIWPVLKVMGETALDRSWESPLALWSSARPGGQSDDAIEEITRLQLLLQAFGEPVPLQAWTQVLVKAPILVGRIPNAILSASMLQAASERRQGDVLLLSLVMLGDPGPANASAGVIGDIVRGLVSAGLPSEARALALDALLPG